MPIQLWYKSEDIGINQYKMVADHYESVEAAKEDVSRFTQDCFITVLDSWQHRREGGVDVYEASADQCRKVRSLIDLDFRIVAYPDQQISS